MQTRPELTDGASQLALACIMLLWSCAANQTHTAPPPAAQSGQGSAPALELPETLAVPADQQLGFQTEARGVQIYACQVAPGGEANHSGGRGNRSAGSAAPDLRHMWVLSAPEAELFDAAGNLAGKHYAGPTWELLDGSRVSATKQSEHVSDTTAIPWLLLRATEHGGQGTLSNVTYIVRKNTSGGLAPSAGCDAAHGGDTARVPYSAVYAFYVAR